jgi:hypothetical protein
MAAAPTMTSPLAAPESGSPQPGGDASAALQPGALGEEQPEPEKPEYGPVMPLDAVETSPGATLLGAGIPAGPSTLASAAAGAAPVGTAPAADPTAAKVLVRGEPLAPKEGRADDFRWPRPPTASAAIKTSSRPIPVQATP